MRWVLVSMLVSTAAAAQDDSGLWRRLAEQNQLGLLEYCAAQGYSTPGAVVAQRPAAVSGVWPAGEAANAAGRAGTIRVVDPQATLAESAAASGTTVAYRCQQMMYALR